MARYLALAVLLAACHAPPPAYTITHANGQACPANWLRVRGMFIEANHTLQDACVDRERMLSGGGGLIDQLAPGESVSIPVPIR